MSDPYLYIVMHPEILKEGLKQGEIVEEDGKYYSLGAEVIAQESLPNIESQDTSNE